MNDDLVLWSDARFCSPWVLTVWIALKEKGLSFDVQELDLSAGQHKKGDYPRMTVTGKVPALTHGDVWIAESLAILEYLEEIFPQPAIFADTPEGRAVDRMVLAHLRSDFAELRRCLPYEGIFVPIKAPAPTAEARAQARRLLELVDWRLTTRGKAPLTIADFELACTLRRLVSYKLPVPAHARAFSTAIWKRPSVTSWLALDRSRFDGAGKRSGARQEAKRGRARR